MSAVPMLRPATDRDLAAWRKLWPEGEPRAGSYVGWLGKQAIATVTLHPLGAVVDLRDFAIAGRELAKHGDALLQQIVVVAKHCGKVITVEYPPQYSPLFLAAYFKQNTRTRMVRSLADWQVQKVCLPAGIVLRPLTWDDEEALIDHVQGSYRGAADEDMVCSSRQQAVGVVGDTLHDAYCHFDWANSRLVVDAGGYIVGNLLLGDISAYAPKTLLIANISLDPAWQGKGLGGALMSHALNAAKAADFNTVRLLVTIGNWPAQALYRGFGFVEEGAVRFEAVLRTELRMRMCLRLA